MKIFLSSIFISFIVVQLSAQGIEFDCQSSAYYKYEGTLFSKNNYTTLDSAEFFKENIFQLSFYAKFDSRIGKGQKEAIILTLSKANKWSAVRLIEKYRINSYYKTKEWERESKKEYSSLNSEEVLNLWNQLVAENVLDVKPLQRKFKKGNLEYTIGNPYHSTYYGLTLIKEGCFKTISFNATDFDRIEYKDNEDVKSLKKIKETLENL